MAHIGGLLLHGLRDLALSRGLALVGVGLVGTSLHAEYLGSEWHHLRVLEG